MSVTALHVPFKKEFEPIVRPLENVALAWDTNEAGWRYYRVKYVEPFFVDYSTPTIANGSSTNVKISDIELPNNVLGQIRIVALTSGFEIEVWLPQSQAKYATKNTITRIKDWVVNNYPWLTEMFYLGDGVPKFTVFNNSGSDGSASIRIVGFKYYLEQLAERPRELTVIYVATPPPPR